MISTYILLSVYDDIGVVVHQAAVSWVAIVFFKFLKPVHILEQFPYQPSIPSSVPFTRIIYLSTSFPILSCYHLEEKYKMEDESIGGSYREVDT